jgi:membrane protease subunit HflC
MQSVTPPSDEVKRAFNEVNGEPARAPITTPGLKVKLPFVQTVHRFDKRILEWDGLPGQIPTLDKRFIVLDTTARWRIADPLRFLQSVGEERAAQSRLDDLINSAARDVISSHLLIQAVRTFARELPAETLEEAGSPEEQRVTAEAKPDATAPPTVKEVAPEERLGRDTLTALMVKQARQNMAYLGIELIDVRITSINYVRELDRIRSEAYRKAQDSIGKADAEAARIYAEAYSQDPEFYAFYQTLDAYKQTLQKNSSLLVTTGSDFYRYLKSINGVVPHATAKNGKP